MTDFEDHIKALGEVADRVRKQLTLVNTDAFESLLGAQRNFEKALGPFLAAHKQMADVARSITIPQVELPAFVLPQFELPDLPYLNGAVELGKSLHDAISPALQDIRESIRDLPPRTQEALLTLGSHGWYLDFEWTMPQLWTLR